MSRNKQGADVDPDRLRDLVRDLAECHDNNCSPELRGRARNLLNLGECDPRQGCIFRGGCSTCGPIRQET